MAKRNGGIIGPSNVPTGRYGGTASGVWRLRDAFNYIKADLWPGLGNYSVENSARFVTGDSLTRTVTPSSSTSYTVSFWLKLSDVTYSSTPYLWSVGSSAGGNGIYLSDSDRKIYFFDRPSGFLSLYDGALRDPSAWYHVVWSVNSGTGTGYINGITGNTHSSIPALNDNTGDKISIHDYVDNTLGLTFVGCYMSEFNFIDGQALTPSSFGQTDSATGIWIPKPYYGTYGTNGFYQKYANSAALGTDSSGNGNNFTVNNLTSVDQSTDTPTNNFCTLNALSKGSALSLTNGNLTCTNDSTWRSVMSTIAVSTGKWYWEAKVVSLGTINFGVTKSKQNGTDHDNVDAGRIMWSSNGNLYDEGFGNSPVSIGTFTTNDIIGLALDLINGTLALYKNGTLVYTYSNAGLTTNEMTPANGVNTATGDMNFGSPPFTIASGNADANGYGNFEYAVPSGYYALCTKNLATYG